MDFIRLAFLFLVVVGGAAAQRTLVYEPVRSLPSEDKRWALLIGVDQYEDGQMTGLDGASNDAKALAKLLEERCGFRKDHIIVLASKEPDPRKPTRSEILFRLSNILHQIPRDGLFFLAFSGHGMERGGRAFLLPSDARLSDDPEILQQVSLDVETMRRIVARQGIQQVLILLDACRNDPGGRADSVNPLSESFVRGFNFEIRNREVQAFATLYSTAVGDRAWENKETKQGYFTWAVGEALSGRAANEKGEVTLAALVRYVQDAVPIRVALDLGAGKRQRPFARIEGYRADELVVGVTPRQLPPAPPVNATDDEAIYWKQCEQRGVLFCGIYLQRFPKGRFAPLARALAERASASTPASPAPEVARLEPQAAPPVKTAPAQSTQAPANAGATSESVTRINQPTPSTARPTVQNVPENKPGPVVALPAPPAKVAPPPPTQTPADAGVSSESVNRIIQPNPAAGPPPVQSVPQSRPEPVATTAVPTENPSLRKHVLIAPSLRSAGEKQRSSRDKMHYIWIPPGRFRMGCAADPGCDASERPALVVQLTKGFWIGQTEVTVGAYRRFRQATNTPPLPDRDKRGVVFNEAARDEKQPAVAATWDEAKRYCEWAGLRLPTEAEWEYAASGGGSPAKSFILDNVAWYGDNSGRMRIDSTRLWASASKPQDYLQLVSSNGNGLKSSGLKDPNLRGLHDMLGNASEWTADWYAPDYYKRNESIDPPGPQEGQSRVVRGGGWVDPGMLVAVTRRSAAKPETRAPWLGFRCAGERLP